MARKKLVPKRPPTRRSERLEARVKVKEEQKEAAKISKPKRFRRPRQRKGCHLLNLPGELRNRIYELAVLQDVGVFIDTEGPGEPKLLQTCRRIRNEAGSLYYGSNEFFFCIESYNGADFLPFARQAQKYQCFRVRQNVRFLMDRVPSWDNLVAWIKACYTQGALEPEFKNRTNKEDFVVSSAFKLADECGFWSWQRKEDVLKTLYQALRGTNSAWVKAEDRVW